MKRILVTGGAGFVGTNLIKRLLKENHEVISLDNYSTGYKTNHQPGCEYIEGEINQIDFDKTFGKVDLIYHLAALARIQPSLTQPELFIKNNFMGTLSVLEYARKHNIQVIYSGSSSKHHGLYGSPYAWSKYGGEELCKLYSSVYDLNTTICRFYNVYGPHHLKTGEYATVIGIFEDQFTNNKPLTIVGTGEQKRDFTHINDIVDGLVRCIGHNFKAEIFELGRGNNFSINEIANLFGKSYPKINIPQRDGEYDSTLCSDPKAKEILGWSPKENLDNYIKKFIKK